MLISADFPAPPRRLIDRRERVVRLSRVAFELRRLDAVAQARGGQVRSTTGTPAPESTAVTAAPDGSPEATAAAV